MKFPIIALAFSCIFFYFSFTISPANTSNSEKINQLEFDSLIKDYKNRYPDGTWGGVLSRDSIQLLINNMSEDSTIVNYIFTTDFQFNKTSLAMRSSINSNDSNTPLCFRNGKIEAAFCPDSCTFQTNNVDGTLRISYSTYKELFTNYVENNANSTYGGCFDKESLALILTSLKNDNLNFRFYYNSEYNKIGVIFIGGEDDKNETIYIKNGIRSESYCPTNCQD